MDRVHKVGWSMDPVHKVVHGPGPHGWSMDLGPCFVYVLCDGDPLACSAMKSDDDDDDLSCCTNIRIYSGLIKASCMMIDKKDEKF